MKNAKLKIAVLAIATGLFVGCNNDSESVNDTINPDQAVDNTSDVIEGQYIVVLKDGNLSEPAARGTKEAYETSMKALNKEVATNFKGIITNKEDIKATFGYALQGFVANLSKEQYEALSKDPRVDFIENDHLISLSPAKETVEENTELASRDFFPWGIDRVGGPANPINRSAWIIDTGIDLDHPDLRVNTGRSRTFVTSGADASSANDRNGHGTHVAGTVGALRNNFGVIGVAPGADLIALKVLAGNGTGQFSWTVQALDYVAANGRSGDVVNMSLGPRSRFTDSATDNAVRRVASRGIRVVLAAGNSNDDSRFYSPARVNATNVYTISNMDINERIARTSNFGSPVDYAAPGTSIWSTWIGGGYQNISGTSMAAPHVTGLLLSGGVRSGGLVRSDKDSNRDRIAVRR
ncbi:S8 family serine peptidase [Tenacibaculum agarivorans]|uniref:S8 family serine peptidase n=1 Tax=Tenacibaculum agarivorans TaxID=1908389 RepID=UPI00094BA7A6|nr:S8 family serine peptidase [Tenacibaculum agarivorans]